MNEFVSPQPQSAAVQPLRKLHIIVMLVCMSATFLDGFDVQIISFMAPAIARELQVEKGMLGAIFSAGIAGMLVGLIAQGPLSDRYGRKPVILVSIALFGLCSLACALAQNTGVLLALRLIGGIGLGAMVPNIFALGIEFSPLRLRSRMVVLLGIGVPIGGLFAGLLSAWVLPVVGWRTLFALGGIMPLLLLPAVAKLLPESPMFLLDRAARRAETDGYTYPDEVDALIRRGWERSEALDPPIRSQGMTALMSANLRRKTLLLWTITAANMIIFYSLLSWMPLLLASSGKPDNLAALSGAMLNLGAVAGSFPAGWIADRVGTGKLLAWLLVIGAGALCLAGALLTGPVIPLLVLCAVMGVVSGGGNLVLIAYTGAIYPTAVRATGIGLAGVAGRGGAILGPLVCGFLLAAGLEDGVLLALCAGPALVAAFACTKLQ